MEKPKVVKSLKKILPDFREIVRSLQPLHTGREFPNFFLKPREAWANWLVCAVLNHEQHINKIVFAEDDKVDGLIVDNRTGEYIKAEHVSALDSQYRANQAKSSQRIIDAINLKIQKTEEEAKKGNDYATNKILVVFFDGAGEWYRNEVRLAINGRHQFKKIYLVGLMTEQDGVYTYSVTRLHEDNSETFTVAINASFTRWVVKYIPNTMSAIEALELSKI